MTRQVSCSRCGEEFDPDREPATRGADTSRCPRCGCEHDVAPQARSAAEGAGGGTTVEIHAEDGATVVVGRRDN